MFNVILYDDDDDKMISNHSLDASGAKASNTLIHI